MLICLRFCDIREVENLARMQHRLSQCGLFGVVHSFEKDRHQECGNLIVSNFASGHAIDEERDLFTRKLRAVTFLADDILRPQCKFKLEAALPLDVRKVSGPSREFLVIPSGLRPKITKTAVQAGGIDQPIHWHCGSSETFRTSDGRAETLALNSL